MLYTCKLLIFKFPLLQVPTYFYLFIFFFENGFQNNGSSNSDWYTHFKPNILKGNRTDFWIPLKY